MKDKLIELFGEKWFYALEPFLLSTEFLELGKKINILRVERKVYPEKEEVFRIFKESNPESINVVFLINQSVGKNYCGHPICGCGSYFNSIAITNWRNELVKEYPELDSELKGGNSLDWQDLSYLIEQNVFFLNMQLTGDSRITKSHEAIWVNLITYVIKYLIKNVNIIWILLGSDCHKYEELIPIQSKVIKTEHPADDEWFGSGVFRRINFELESNGRLNINW